MVVSFRSTGNDSDNRWLSGTHLLVHPASKHLGNARVRIKVLLELKPQSSGRASSRQWQVPHIAPAVTRAILNSPAANIPTNGHIAADAHCSEGTVVNTFPLASNVFRPGQSVAMQDQQAEDTQGAPEQPTAAAAPATAGDRSTLTATQAEATELDSNLAAQHDAEQSVTLSTVTAAVSNSSTAGTNADSTAAVSVDTSPQHIKLKPEAPHAGNPLHESRRSAKELKVSDDEARNSKNGQSNMLLLCVERALHLAIPDVPYEQADIQQAQTNSSKGGQSMIRVAFTQGEQLCSTSAVAVTPGGGAIWQHEVQLERPEQDSGSDLQQMLKLQVCSVPT